MTLLLVVAIGVLVGLGGWLLLDRDLIRIVLGALLLGHGAVLMLMAPRAVGAPPLLGPGGTVPEGIGDPVPQALALTAIVISFAVATLLLAVTRVISGEDVISDPTDADVDTIATSSLEAADMGEMRS